jgi:hypothetical protein
VITCEQKSENCPLPHYNPFDEPDPSLFAPTALNSPCPTCSRDPKPKLTRGALSSSRSSKPSRTTSSCPLRMALIVVKMVMGKGLKTMLRAPLKNGAAVHRSRLKIAIDIASILKSSEAPARTGRSFSLARVEINNGWRARSDGLDPTLSGICRAISSPRSRHSGPVELRWSRERLVKRIYNARDMISMSHWPRLGLESTHLLLSGTSAENREWDISGH